MVHRVGRPDGSQPRPSGRGDRAGRGSRRAGAPGRDHRRDARRRPPVVAAPARRDVAAGPRPSRAGRAPSTRSRRSRRTPSPRAASVAAPPRPVGRRIAGPAGMTETSARPVEVELKYRVVDLAAAERYLVADEIGAFSGTAAARSSQFEDRYVDTADGALTRAGFAVRVRQSGRGTIVSVKSLARTEGPGGVAPARRAGRTRRSDRRPARMAGVRRAVARPRAGRRCAARRAGHDPPAAAQAHRARRRHAGRAEPRRGRRRLALARRRPVRRARGRAGQGRRGAARRRWPRSSPRIRPSRRPAGASSRRRWRPFVRVAAGPVRQISTGLQARRGLARPMGGPTTRPTSRETRSSRSRGRTDGAAASRGRATRRARGSEPATWQESGRGLDPAAAVSGPIRFGNAVLVGRGQRSGRRGRSRPTTASSSARPRASPPTTTSPRPVARSCASTSPGCSPARPARATAWTPRNSTRCASRPVGNGPRGASSVRRSGRGRTKRYRRGLREIASRLGAVRDLDVLLDAADAYRADLPVSEQRALEPLLTDWREHRDDARVLLIRELDSDGYRRWVDDYRDFVRTEGVALMPVGPTQPHHVRDTAAVADLGCLRAGPWLRAGAALGRCRDAPRAAHRRQVAALHARIRARGARRRRRAADRPGHRAPGPPRA